MSNLRNLAFYIIIISWLSLLGIICGILISPLPFVVQNVVTFIPLIVAIIFLLLTRRVYRNLNQEDKIFLRRGAAITTISALVGNLVFLFIDNAWLVARLGLDSLLANPLFVLLEVLITSCIVAVPSFVCGGALAFELLRDLTYRTYSTNSSIFKSAVLGMTLGVSLCIGIGMLLGPHASFEIWLTRSIIATTIAGLAGIWAGWKLGNLISQTRDV